MLAMTWQQVALPLALRGNSATRDGRRVAGGQRFGPNAKAPGNERTGIWFESYVSGNKTRIAMGYNTKVSEAPIGPLSVTPLMLEAAPLVQQRWVGTHTSTAASGVAVGRRRRRDRGELGGTRDEICSRLANRANTVSVGTAGATRQIVEC